MTSSHPFAFDSLWLDLARDLAVLVGLFVPWRREAHGGAAPRTSEERPRRALDASVPKELGAVTRRLLQDEAVST
jgi:hypothetical protein